MNLHDPKAFAITFRQLDATDSPKAIREAFESDQAAIDQGKLWKTPDGEYFEISRALPCSTRVTETGRWIPPEEFSLCEKVA